MTGRLLVVLMACSFWIFDLVADTPLEFESEQQEQRFQQLTEELRCVVCQNQTLADSDAPLAHDLRAEIHEMMLQGQSDDQIRTFLVDRYGDFVLYRPAVKGNTLMLWLAPAILLLLGALVVFFAVRRHRLLPEESAGVESVTQESGKN